MGFNKDEIYCYCVKTLRLSCILNFTPGWLWQRYTEQDWCLYRQDCLSQTLRFVKLNFLCLPPPNLTSCLLSPPASRGTNPQITLIHYVNLVLFWATMQHHSTSALCLWLWHTRSRSTQNQDSFDAEISDDQDCTVCFCNRLTELNVWRCVVKFPVLQQSTAADVNHFEIPLNTQCDLIQFPSTHRNPPVWMIQRHLCSYISSVLLLFFPTIHNLSYFNLNVLL